MARSYLVNVRMCLVVEASNTDLVDVAENVYARCQELAASEDHLLDLEVEPFYLPVPPSGSSH